MFSQNVWKNWYSKVLPSNAWSGPFTFDPTTPCNVYIVFDDVINSVSFYLYIYIIYVFVFSYFFFDFTLGLDSY